MNLVMIVFTILVTKILKWTEYGSVAYSIISSHKSMCLSFIRTSRDVLKSTAKLRREGNSKFAAELLRWAGEQSINDGI